MPQPLSENEEWKLKYPINTFSGTTREELVVFVESLLSSQKQELISNVEEIIGLPEPVIGGARRPVNENVIRNQLRADLRAKLQELM